MTENQNKPKIFVILSRFPYPLEKGDKLRAFHQIRELSNDFEIHLAAISDVPIPAETLDKLKPYCVTVKVFRLNKIGILFQLFRTFFSDKPFQVGYFFKKRIKKQINALIQEIKPALIYCQLIRVAEYVKEQPIPKVLDYMDAFSIGALRHSEKAPFYLKPLLNMEFRRLIRYEKEVFQYFQHHTIISEQDREHIQHPQKNSITIVRNGVDFAYFKNSVDSEKKYTLLFTGNMAYPPNVEAAVFLARKVMPLVVSEYPEAKLLIAGATPAAQVRELASEHVVVSGWLDDIRTAYNQSLIFIAPMHLGIGLQNKLLEAMSMKLPCITSPLANNALKAKPDEEILIADTPQKYFEAIKLLVDNPVKRTNLAEKGFQFVRNNNDWQKQTSILKEIFLELIK